MTIRHALAYVLSPLEEKRDPTGAATRTRRLSMLRCAIAAFTATMCVRLLRASVPPMTWPEYAAMSTILFAIPLAKWLDGAGLTSLVSVLKGLTQKGEADA